MKDLKLKPTEILVLRTCNNDGTSWGGFQWPKEGRVECPDWNPTPECGGGLHGLPWGVGCADYLGWHSDANNGWVVRVDTSKDYVHGEGDFDDICKFKSGMIVLSNANRKDCIDLISKYAPPNSKINWASQVGHNNSIQTAGDYSDQTAGWCATQTAGCCSTQIAEADAFQTSGFESIQMAGEYSTQTCWDKCYQKAGSATSQTSRWFDCITNTFKVSIRIVDETSANKWFYVEKGIWRLATKNEIKMYNLK